MSAPETVASNKKQSLLHRNSSQLLQHASKFGLRRSVTTKKASTSPQIQPRTSTSSVSFSSSTNTNNKRYLQRKKPEDIPSIPYITLKSTTEHILSSSSNNQFGTSPPTKMSG
jgi:hypothetical protein